MSISRRSFLKTSAAATAMSIAGGTAGKVLGETTGTPSAPGNKWPGRVVVNFNKNAVTGTASSPKVAADVVATMVDDSIMLLTGEKTVGAAWKAIFPSTLSATSKIAIKTNFYNNTLVCPHWSSLLAITKGLAQMDFSGTKFPLANITIFEANTSNSFDSAGYKAADFGQVSLVKDSQSVYSDAATGETKYCTSLNKADFMLNVFGARGHDPSYAEGFTLGGKSHYGTYPAGIHTSPAFSVRCANMMSTGAVNKKLVLSVSSALFANNEGTQYQSGPADFSAYAKQMDATATSTFGACTIVMSTDAVSADMQAIKILRMNKNNKATGVNDMPKYLRACAGISGALSVNYNIGVLDEAKMDVKKILNGQVIGGVPVVEKDNLVSVEEYALHVAPLNTQGTVFIEFSVPTSRLNSKATISMYDMLGNLVYANEKTILNIRSHFSWDRKTAQGRTLGTGKYVCKLTIGRINRSTTFAIV
jgi:hypothetical protein